jgi:nitroimidazol reductase NimA-like FMN-containing flavoprotein (pyridoxamine 5'-phosphate oxidase superfamily)
MFGKLNDTEIEELLNHQFIGRIACHTDGVTYVVPISYAYDGTSIYAHSLEGMKVNMMRKNPQVCFEVDNTKNLSNWQSVVAWGTYEELTDGDERANAIHRLGERSLPILSSETMHLSPEWPFLCECGNDVKGIIFRVRLTKKTGRYERSEDKYFFAT